MAEIIIPKSETGPFAKLKDLTTWGEKEFLICKNYIANWRTCLDIGAHIGLTSLRYSQYFNSVHSFEPILHEYIKENTESSSNITVHPYAVSDEKKIVRMWPNPYNTGRSIVETEANSKFVNKSYKSSAGRYSDVKCVDIQTATIDEFEFENVDFVKIDVEGYNVPVLNGMLKTLDRCSPVVQIEDTKDLETNKQVKRIFASLGYTMVHEIKGNPKDFIYCRNV